MTLKLTPPMTVSPRISTVGNPVTITYIVQADSGLYLPVTDFFVALRLRINHDGDFGNLQPPSQSPMHTFSYTTASLPAGSYEAWPAYDDGTGNLPAIDDSDRCPTTFRVQS